MTTKTVSTTIAGPTRTAVQMGPWEALIQMTEAFGWTHLTANQHATLLIVLTLATSYTQNLVENLTGKAFLRRVPPKRVPVVDDGDATPAKKKATKTAKKPARRASRG